MGYQLLASEPITEEPWQEIPERTLVTIAWDAALTSLPLSS